MQKPRPLHKRAPITCFLFLWVALVGALLAVPAQAVPAFARQTGENCVACHTAFPELTPFGREFKLNGYTWGERQALPLALMMQGSLTQMAQSKDAGGRTLVPHLGDLQFDRLTAFAAGKITDNVGGYTQWAYNNNQSLGHDGGTVGHAGIHDFDLRAVKRLSLAGKDLLLGHGKRLLRGAPRFTCRNPQASTSSFAGAAARGLPPLTYSHATGRRYEKYAIRRMRSVSACHPKKPFMKS